MVALTRETIRETPAVLRGTELEAPSVARWNASTTALLVAGVVVLADPIIFFVGSLFDIEETLIRRPSLLVSAPFFTAFWALVVVKKARRAATSGRMIGYAVFGAAMNAATLVAVLAEAEGAEVVGAIVVGLLAVVVTLPVSVPVGLFVGALLWAMHHWERSLRDAPTQDARVRWISVAAVWVGVVGVVGELLTVPCHGYAWRSESVAALAWGPRLALFAGFGLALVAAWRTWRLRRLLEDIDAGRVRGLKLGGVVDSSEALTAGRPDGRILQAEGQGAFRTAQLELGTISRRSAKRRMWGMLVLAAVALILGILAIVRPIPELPFLPPPPTHFW